MPKLVEQIRRLPYNGEEIGMGFNSDTGKAVGTALEFAPPTGEPGQTHLAEATIVSSQQALSSALSMSMEVSAHYGMISAGLKAEFQKDSTFNSTSTFVIARSKIENQIKRGRNFRIREDANTLLESNRSREFDTAFGDSFVRGIFTGGEYYALIRITSMDRSVQTQLSLTIQAEINGGLAGGSFTGAYTNANRQSESRSEYHIKFYQRGGAGREVSATIDVDEMKERLRSFPAAVQRHPYPYEIEVARYDTIPIPVPPKQQQESFLLALADADATRLRYIQHKNDFAFAAEHPEFFVNLPPAEDLLRAADLYTRALNAVIGHAVRLSRGELDSGQYFFNPATLVPPLELPTLRLKRRTSEHARSFVDWYVLRTAPGILNEDRLFLDTLAEEAIPRIQDFAAIRDPGGNPEVTEKARAQALRPIVERFTEFQLIDKDVRTLGHLPDIVPAGLESLWLSRCGLTDIRGIGRLRALRFLALDGNQLSEVSELAELEQLRTLNLNVNAVTDIAPLEACTELESLSLAGNQVMNLGPLASLSKLKMVEIASLYSEDVNGRVTHSFHTNPVISIDPLRGLAALANPFLSGNELAVRVAAEQDGAGSFEGVARRIGRSHVFQVMLSRGNDTRTEEWSLLSVASLQHPNTGETVVTAAMLIGGLPRFFSVALADRSRCTSPGVPPAGVYPARPLIEVRILG